MSALTGADPAFVALQAEARGFSPPVARSLYIGDVVLTTDAEIETFAASYYGVSGNLTATSSGVTNMTLLSDLEVVTGNLTVSNVAATSANLPKLVVSGAVTVQNNTSLLAIDLSSSTEVNSVSISGNSPLQTINLGSLEEVSDTVSIQDNANLKTIRLDSLSVTNSLTLQNNTSLTTIRLPALQTLYSNLTVSNNTNLTTLDLNTLDSVYGNLAIEDTKLNVIDLSSLTYVLGTLTLDNNTTTSVDASSLNTVGGDINLQNNDIGTIDFTSIISIGYGKAIRTANYSLDLTITPVDPNAPASPLVTIDIGVLVGYDPGYQTLTLVSNPDFNLVEIVVETFDPPSIVTYTNADLATLPSWPTPGKLNQIIFPSGVTTTTGTFRLEDNEIENVDFGTPLGDTVAGGVSVKRNNWPVGGGGTFGFPFDRVNGPIEVEENNRLETILLTPMWFCSCPILIRNEPDLTEIDLGTLTDVEGDLEFSDNPELINIDLGGLPACPGTLEFERNDGLQTIDLGALTTLDGLLTLSDNPSLISVDLGSLSSISLGAVFTRMNMSALNFAALTTLPYIEMDDCYGSITGTFPVLTTVTDHIYGVNTASTNTLSAVSAFPSLTSIGPAVSGVFAPATLYFNRRISSLAGAFPVLQGNQIVQLTNLGNINTDLTNVFAAWTGSSLSDVTFSLSAPTTISGFQNVTTLRDLEIRLFATQTISAFPVLATARNVTIECTSSTTQTLNLSSAFPVLTEVTQHLYLDAGTSGSNPDRMNFTGCFPALTSVGTLEISAPRTTTLTDAFAVLTETTGAASSINRTVYGLRLDMRLLSALSGTSFDLIADPGSSSWGLDIYSENIMDLSVFNGILLTGGDYRMSWVPAVNLPSVENASTIDELSITDVSGITNASFDTLCASFANATSIGSIHLGLFYASSLTSIAGAYDSTVIASGSDNPLDPDDNISVIDTQSNAIGSSPLSPMPLYEYNAAFNASTNNLTVSDSRAAGVPAPYSLVVPNFSEVVFSTTGTLPSPLVPGTTYWTSQSGPTTSKLSTSYTNAVDGVYIDLTSSGSGEHYTELPQTTFFLIERGTSFPTTYEGNIVSITGSSYGADVRVIYRSGNYNDPDPLLDGGVLNMGRPPGITGDSTISYSIIRGLVGISSYGLARINGSKISDTGTISISPTSNLTNVREVPAIVGKYVSEGWTGGSKT